MRVHRGSVVAICAVLLSMGCTPTAPSTQAPSGWRSQAAHTVEAVASELATARLVLVQHERGRLFTSTATVMLVQAEDACGSAVQAFNALQPPAATRSEDADVSAGLARASELLRSSRIALVESGQGDRRLVDLLQTTRDDLTARAERLRAE